MDRPSYNRLVDLEVKANDFSYRSPISRESNLPDSSGSSTYPWKVTVTNDPTGAGTTTIRVNKGRWRQYVPQDSNPGILCTADLTLVTDVGEDYKTVAVSYLYTGYIYAVTQRTDAAKDKRVYADVVIASTDISSGTNPSQYRILGECTAGVWKQWWTGGDINDVLSVPDAAAGVNQHTIEITANGVTQLHDANITKGGNPNVPYLEDYGGVRSLKWAAPDSQETTKKSYSIELKVPSGATEVQLQLFNFDTGTTESTMVDQQLIGRKVDGGIPSVVYVTFQDLADDIANTITGGTGGTGGFVGSLEKPDHSELADIALGTCEDDHNKSQTDSCYLKDDGNEERNAMQTGSCLGDSGEYKSVDVDQRILYGLKTVGGVTSAVARASWANSPFCVNDELHIIGSSTSKRVLTERLGSIDDPATNSNADLYTAVCAILDAMRATTGHGLIED